MVLVDAFLIINELKDEFDINEKYTKKKLMDLMIEKCKKYTKAKKIQNDKDKKITVYNEFVKTQMPIIRAEFPNLFPKEHMTLIGKKWRVNKMESDKNVESKNNVESKDNVESKKNNVESKKNTESINNVESKDNAESKKNTELDDDKNIKKKHKQKSVKK